MFSKVTIIWNELQLFRNEYNFSLFEIAKLQIPFKL